MRLVQDSFGDIYFSYAFTLNNKVFNKGFSIKMLNFYIKLIDKSNLRKKNEVSQLEDHKVTVSWISFHTFIKFTSQILSTIIINVQTTGFHTHYRPLNQNERCCVASVRFYSAACCPTREPALRRTPLDGSEGPVFRTLAGIFYQSLRRET